jgi:hypothetical protein
MNMAIWRCIVACSWQLFGDFSTSKSNNALTLFYIFFSELEIDRDEINCTPILVAVFSCVMALSYRSRHALRALMPASNLTRQPFRRPNSTTSATTPEAVDVSALLATPTWPLETITRAQLHHLLRLAALEPPAADSPDERDLLRTLSAQLHFVRQVQAVEIPAGVEPLRAVRDESARGRAEAAVGMGTEGVREALGREVWRGKFWRRVRRDAGAPVMAADEPVGLAEGREFVVDRGTGEG